MPHHLLIPGIIIFLVILGYVVLAHRKHARSHDLHTHTSRKPVQATPPPIRPVAPIPEPEAPCYVSPPPPRKTDADWRSELADATTVDECMHIFNSVPSDSPLEAEAKAKIIRLCTTQLAEVRTIDDCWDLRKEVVDADLDWDETDAIINQAMEKALELATTYEEAKDLFVSLEEASEEQAFIAAAVKKAIGLADFDECISFVSELGNYADHEEDEDVAFRTALSLAKTADDCEQLRNDLSLNDEEDDEVRTKLIGLTDTVDGCQAVWDDVGTDSHLGEVAICRAADIIRKRAAQLIEPAQAPAE